MSKSPPRSLLRQLYPALAWLVLIAVFGQVALAMFGVSFRAHVALGAAIGALSLLLALIAYRAQLSGTSRTLSVVLPCLLVLQLLFIGFDTYLPILTDLHAINAFVILGVALVLALDAEDEETISHVP